MDNTKLAASLRSLNEQFELDTLGSREPLLDQAAAALEAAEAELTRRDTTIADVRNLVPQWASGVPDQFSDQAEYALYNISHRLQAADAESALPVHGDDPAIARVRRMADEDDDAAWLAHRRLISRILAAAPVSLEAVKAETKTEWLPERIHWGVQAGDHPARLAEYQTRDMAEWYLVHPFPADEGLKHVLVTRKTRETVWRPVETEGANRV